MNCLGNFYTPQLEVIHRGKVRDSVRVDAETRMIVVSDRISSFDNVLNNYVPQKGAVLTGITNFWFEKTRHLVDNHFIKMLDPNISLVKEAQPIKIEMIVRGYLTGSMWRGYKAGKRDFSGVMAPDGLQENDKFPTPLVTPTTKEEIDRPITPEDIVKEGWSTKAIYDKMQELSLKLFAYGSEFLAERGIILVDTKYEFGIVDGEIILIDEIHTPDSSRFWSLEDYQKDPTKVDSIDKEYVRQWLRANQQAGKYPELLSEEVISETNRRYLDIYEKITGKKLNYDFNENIKARICRNLVAAGLIKDAFISIIMGSPRDLEHCQKIAAQFEKYDIFVDMRVTSAHKNGERIPGIVETYNNAIEPGVVIAVAGRSNGLGGALAANLAIPLINCPPFKDKVDMMVNINSSLVMPSHTPASTIIDISCAAGAAVRALNLPRMKAIFVQEMQQTKADLVAADNQIRKKLS
ncbi:MAG: phosphoribosylaminoimidazolesuccinocarboxamide synthase [Candidatus Cloacimonadales bacterium]